MRQLQLMAHGEPTDVIELNTVSEPTLGQEDVLVSMEAAPLNLCDSANHVGNVFKLSPSGGGWTYTSLHDFTGGDDGKYPISSVIVDANGNLYGTASGGGSQGHGVWEITP